MDYHHHQSGPMQSAVVPGAASGVYYILVANLSPDMSVNELRFLARQAGCIEKCFVYPGGGEGWVRVLGRSSFWKVFNHLNGLEYSGTTITASSQNEHETVYIWEFQKPANSDGAYYKSAPAGSSLRYSSGGHLAAYDEGFGTAAYDGHAVPAEPGSTEGANGYYPHYGYDQYGAPGGELGCDWEALGGYAKDQLRACTAPLGLGCDGDEAASQETCKIVVKHLSRHASRKDLEDFLHKASGGKHKLQEAVRFPRPINGVNRQHAFLLFRSHDDAVKALGRLDKARFCGLTVEARFSAETVSPVQPEAPVASAAASSTSTSSTSTKPPGQIHQALVVDGSSGYGLAKKTQQSASSSSSLCKSTTSHEKEAKQHRSGIADGGFQRRTGSSSTSSHGSSKVHTDLPHRHRHK